ncbi:MAG: IPT/TIG domain-containing protein [Actinobacteria bacterium]|nr:IPT/TIG domain-containing protein [Actinomycetota bacterium]MBU2686965.1 IPT/TIG domain-containing protein [Actinomycetota bacterium]
MGIRVNVRAGGLGPSRQRSKNRIAVLPALAALALSVLAGGFGMPPTAHAQVPVFCDTCWMANGLVRTALNAGDVTYVGGDFTAIGPYTGRGAVLDAATGAATVIPRANSTITAVVPDGSGGWYVGGNFTMLGSTARNRLAHVTASGAVDSWNPNANSTVQSLSLNGTTLYVGGSFTFVGGQTRNRLAALSTVSGNATGWNPAPNSTVYTQQLSADGTTLYAGGTFTSIGGQSRNRVAALSTTTGLATAFNPNASSTVYALRFGPGESLIYAGGAFTTVNAVAHPYLAAISTATGLPTAWNPNGNGAVNMLAVTASGATVYAGGAFTNIGGQARNRIAAVDSGTGLATVWNPNANSTVSWVMLSGDESIVYVSGSFTTVGGATRNYIAALSAVTGLATSWDPNASAAVSVMALSGTNIFAGGSFISIGRLARNRIAALDTATGEGTSWNPSANGSVYTIKTSPDGATVYAGGAFTSIGGQARNRVAALSATTGLSTGWNPSASSNLYALGISTDGATVYAGGAFTSIGGQTRYRIAALSAATGLATGWNPNSNSTVSALALSPDASTVYAGGSFTTIGGQSRYRIAALSAATGLATGWNPNSNSTLSTLAVSPDGTTIYAGGAFTTIGGQARNRIAALSAATGLATGWDPDANATVYVLTVAGDLVYAGGSFSSIGGQSRNFSAALDASSGSANGFEPNTNTYVSAIAVGSKTYLGGAFTMVGGLERTYLAGFEYPAPVVTAMNPDSGNQGQALIGVSITGAEFRDVAMTVTLERGADTITAANVNRVSSTEVTCDITIPAGAAVADDWDVVVTNDDDLKSGTLPDGFSVQYPPPVVTGISPDTADQGQTLTGVSVTGSAFRNVSATIQLRRGAETIPGTNLAWVSPNQVTCDFAVPAGATPASDWDVFFQHNDDSKSSTLDDAFTVEYPPPTVVSITPASANNDGVVHITNLAGSGFRTGAGATLSMGGQPDIPATNVVVVSGVRITCDFDLTGAACGDWDVTVTNDDTKSDTLPAGFTVTFEAPTVTSIDPSAANNDAPVSITDLAGTNFRAGATVKLSRPGQPDIDAASVVVVSANQITCDFNITDAATGFWDVTVTNDDLKSGTLPDGFSVQYPPPVVTGISPDTACEGDMLHDATVSGSAFRDVPMSIKLYRGSSTVWATNIRWVSPNSVLCDLSFTTAPSGSGWTLLLSHEDDGKFDTLPDAFTVLPEPPDEPIIASVTPSSGIPGETVTVKGRGFGALRGTSVVTFNGVPATDYLSWSDDTIVLVVPDGATTGAVVVRTEGGNSNSDRYFTVTCPDWYLAEGSTDHGFTTYISIENPNDQDLNARVTYFLADGTSAEVMAGLPALSQVTLDPAETIGAADFATKVECLQGQTIAVDRTMSWTGPGAPSPEGHCSIGIAAPSKTWYMAEGCSAFGFETWVLVFNPSPAPATVDLTYMMEGWKPTTVREVVPPLSRCSYSMGDDIGERNSSIRVDSDVAVVAERSMYRNDRREGSCSVGVTASALIYYSASAGAGQGGSYLPEGTTAHGFESYILVQNPNDTDANVTVTYLTSTGPVPQEPFVMPPDSRRTILVNDALPQTDFSTRVASDRAIVAERAVYWNNGTGQACHASIGLSAPHAEFTLPDGQTSDGRETYLLVANPNPDDVQVEITFLTAGGQFNVSLIATIPANSRATFEMADYIPEDRASILVRSRTPGRKVMAERAMYWNDRGAGTGTVGAYSD